MTTKRNYNAAKLIINTIKQQVSCYYFLIAKPEDETIPIDKPSIKLLANMHTNLTKLKEQCEKVKRDINSSFSYRRRRARRTIDKALRRANQIGRKFIKNFWDYTRGEYHIPVTRDLKLLAKIIPPWEESSTSSSD